MTGSRWFTRAARRLAERSIEEPTDPTDLVDAPESPAPPVDLAARSRKLADLGHALEGFADALRVDRARPDDEARLRALAARARALSVRPHPRADELALASDVPHLVEPDHRATHSTYGHHQLRLDTAVAVLLGG